MNILLTGGLGYIGSHIAVVLSQMGHQVTLYDNLSNSTDAVLENIGKISRKQMSFVRGDVRNTELLTNALTSFGVDAVIHLAGSKSVDESVEKPIDYYANNVQSAISLLQAMHSVRVKSLIFSSSATVYGDPVYLPFDEEHPTDAVSPYGHNKLHVEEMLADVATSDPEWRIACLRYFNPVGAHDSGLIGENPNGIPNNLMPYIAQVASGRRDLLNVFGNDYPTRDGTGVRDYLHVMDLADGHAAALAYLSDHPKWHVINLGTGRGCSVLEMVGAFRAVSGKKIPLRFVPRRAGDIAEFYSNPAKAEREMGWRASRNLESMCASTWNFETRLEKMRKI
ncbi:MAG: UDP-glucose 4-epimerase GalE [Burkholderiales bacterium]|nr:UDP-glucose 4-epimerase GalE [Burkholderiales bacterium]